MAGLVDYGVDSEDDGIRGNSPESVENPPQESSNVDLDQKPTNKTKSDEHSKTDMVPKKHSSSRSSDKSRHKEHHKKKSRSRSQSRSRSKDRHSRSHKRKRSHERKHRHRDDRRKRKSRSHSRSRSRSRSSSPLRVQKPSRRTRSQERREKKAAAIARMGLDVSGLAASVALSGSSSTQQESEKVVTAAHQLLQSQVEQAQQMTGVTLPSFYNPGAVNPMKYAQQIQKRKLLWSNKEKKETPPTTTAKIWEATAFNQDQDGKMTAKFKRLMGIKNESDGVVAGPSQNESVPETVDVLKKQQELFASLDQQYQVARATTHTQRGLGLGFSSKF